MTALNTLLILLTAVCIPGLINRTRAVLAGRRGIRFAQHLYDVRLLLRKGAVYSTTASALFRAVPSVYLGSAIVAALFIPVGELKPLLSFDGDIVCFTYLMALGRFALILGAMDTGSSFEGMEPRSPLRRAGRTGAHAHGRHAGPAGGPHVVRPNLRRSGDGRPAADRPAGAHGLRAGEDRLHRKRPRTGGRSPHPPRTDDDPRSDVARTSA